MESQEPETSTIPAQPPLEEKSSLEELKTPPRTRKVNNTPPPAPVAPWLTFQDLSDDELATPSKSPNTCSPSTPGVSKSKRQCHKTIERSQHTEERDQYSNLFYLEATGATRITKKVKHRLNAASPSVDWPLTPPPVSSEDDDCKLLISYRIHQQTKEFQFALIVYESLAKSCKTRRNLQLEFGEPSTSKTPKTPKTQKNQRTPSASASKSEEQSPRIIDRKRNLRF